MGIEPTSEAWEASILPLYDARSGSHCTCESAGRKAASAIAQRWVRFARAHRIERVSDCAAGARGILDPSGAVL